MGIAEPSGRRVAAVTAVLCLLAYLPFLQLPFISDDYLQIGLARQYGSWEGQQMLFADALYRCRATALWVVWALDRLFGPVVTPQALVCLALHFLNCMLLFALAKENGFSRGAAACGAFFFAIYEGHQEAVVWISALPELLVFLFGGLSLLAGLRWIRGGGAGWLVLTVVSYGLALLSKESAVVVPALLAVQALFGRLDWRRWVPLVGVLGGVVTTWYTWSIFQAKQSHLHFNDGTFNLSAPFLVTLLISIGRLFWFWGLLAVVVGLWSRMPGFGKVLVVAAVWIVLTFLPYTFLTYMPRVPSRHTYWASAGLAMVVGAVFLQGVPRLSDRKRVLAAVAAAVIIHNCGYLWIKKLGQYQERARATEELIAYSRRARNGVRVRCFPYGDDIIYHSLDILQGRKRGEIEIGAQVAGEAYCFVPKHD